MSSSNLGRRTLIVRSAGLGLAATGVLATSIQAVDNDWCADHAPPQPSANPASSPRQRSQQPPRP